MASAILWASLASLGERLAAVDLSLSRLPC